jgi:hypothetical protein
MKHLVLGLLCAVIALSQHPKVSDCFKVQELLRADEEHYWATWTNTCPYTVDSVYVTVRFADRSSKELADGVWSLHFIAPGAHRTMRFSAPGKIADFASVHQKNITADMNEAFGRAPAVSSMELAAVSAYREALIKDGSVRPRATQVAAIIGDPGEGAYQYQSAPSVPVSTESIAKAAFDGAILKYVLESSSVIRASPAVIGDPGEASFRTDFPDPWQAVLSPQESAVSLAPRPSFVKFVTDGKPNFQ